MPKERISIKLDPELISKINDFLETDAGDKLTRDRTELITKAIELYINVAQNKPYEFQYDEFLIPVKINNDYLETLNDVCRDKGMDFNSIMKEMIVILSPIDKTGFQLLISGGTHYSMKKFLKKREAEMKKMLNGNGGADK